MAQIFKPNIDVIRKQAEEAKKQEEKRKQERDGDNDTRWLDISLGDNVVRLLPSTSASGVPFKKVADHSTRYTNLKDIVPKGRCLVDTYEDMEGVVCPYCEVGDEILSTRPDLKIGGWHRPRVRYYGQFISRAESVALPLPRIGGLTPRVKSKFDESILEAYSAQIDITDFFAGVDFSIKKESKQDKNGKDRISYDLQRVGFAGPTPLFQQLPPGFDNFEAVIKVITDNMYVLDDIWGFPNDEKIAKLYENADKLREYYLRQTQVQVPRSTPTAVTPQQVYQQQGYQPQPVQQAPVQVQQPAPVAQAPVQQPVQQVQPQQGDFPIPPQFQVAPQPQAPQAQTPQPQAYTDPVAAAEAAIRSAGQHAPPQAATPVQQPPTASQPALPIVEQPATSPQDTPACFGGAAPRQGTDPNNPESFGYGDDDENCLVCAHEIQCVDAWDKKMEAQG